MTAQILIIGDEILTGHTADTNSNWLAKQLFALGVRVIRVEVLPDNKNLIAEWVRTQAAKTDFTLLCGGIGGTPDDVTRLAVAEGVGVPLVRHEGAKKILLDFYKERINEPRMSMADLPQGCVMIDNAVTAAPGFKIKNIYVFAGVPKILQAMFETVRSDFASEPFYELELKLTVGEGDISEIMVMVNKEFPLLELGSYPTFFPERGYRTQLIFRSRDKNLTSNAKDRFVQLCLENKLSRDVFV